MRRAVAAGVGILILILLVLGVRGCLNARKERAFENYVSDLSSIAADTQSLSKRFFGRLEDPGNLAPLQFEAETKADRGVAEGLLDRAEGLDTPEEVAEAQELIVLSYELRRDGLEAAADLIPAALGDKGAVQAAKRLAEQMRTFLASDVLYARAQEQIEDTLAEEEVVAEESIVTRFLPAEPDWLDSDEVTAALAGVSGSGGPATPGVHGLGIPQGGVTLLPTGALLDSGVPVTALGEGAQLDVQVENQGESEETDVTVRYELQGGGSVTGEKQIPSIAPGEIATVSIPIEPSPSPGTYELTVIAEPVPGEEIEDNNEVSTEVTFE